MFNILYLKNSHFLPDFKLSFKYYLPSEIINGFPDCSDCQDESQWPPIGVEITNLELWDELTQSHDQEEHIEEELELVVQNLE